MGDTTCPRDGTKRYREVAICYCKLTSGAALVKTTREPYNSVFFVTPSLERWRTFTSQRIATNGEINETRIGSCLVLPCSDMANFCGIFPQYPSFVPWQFEKIRKRKRNSLKKKEKRRNILYILYGAWWNCVQYSTKWNVETQICLTLCLICELTIGVQ